MIRVCVWHVTIILKSFKTRLVVDLWMLHRGFVLAKHQRGWRRGSFRVMGLGKHGTCTAIQWWTYGEPHMNALRELMSIQVIWGWSSLCISTKWSPKHVWIGKKISTIPSGNVFVGCTDLGSSFALMLPLKPQPQGGRTEWRFAGQQHSWDGEKIGGRFRFPCAVPFPWEWDQGWSKGVFYVVRCSQLMSIDVSISRRRGRGLPRESEGWPSPPAALYSQQTQLGQVLQKWVNVPIVPWSSWRSRIKSESGWILLWVWFVFWVTMKNVVFLGDDDLTVCHTWPRPQHKLNAGAALRVSCG